MSPAYGRGLTDAERVALADKARGYSLPLVLARGKPGCRHAYLIAEPWLDRCAKCGRERKV